MTTERIDHAAEAQKHIDWAHEQQERDGEYEHSVRDNAILAQAEATLALVEQQRIANLIALDGPWRMPDGARIAHLIHNPETFELSSYIREGLGL